MRNAEYESVCRIIKEASESNQLVVFIGAGMSNNFGFPTWQELTEEMYRALTGKEPAKKNIFPQMNFCVFHRPLEIRIKRFTRGS
ncbi:hypothetical protein [Parablautia intestinalis]|uniref:hypothetical protein n=1 Tax=Parablautia intestinalis TaxID=2320100 RepID=UPI00259CE5C1|nr:hypothetical protein [Parablautia intestinalis]